MSMQSILKARAWIGLLMLVLSCESVLGQVPGLQQQPGQTSRVDVKLVPSSTTIVPGQTIMLGFLFKIQPDWHIYWVNPGADGAAPLIDVEVPDGFQVGPVQWPRPSIFGTADNASFGYSGSVMLMVPLAAPVDATPGRLDVKAELEWLVCRKDVCLLEDATLSRSITISDVDPRAAIPDSMARFVQQLPRPIDRLDGSRVSVKPDTVIITGTMPRSIGMVRFIPFDLPGVVVSDSPPISGLVDAGRFTMRIPLKVDPPHVNPRPFGGVLLFGASSTDPSYYLLVDLPPPGNEQESGQKVPVESSKSNQTSG